MRQAQSFFGPPLSLVGTRHVCQCCNRVATIIGQYDGDKEDPPGYDYVFDGEPGVRWISVHTASVRFRKEKADDKLG